MSVKVLYLAGVAHSGTTILANVLGEVEGFFSAGELRYLWRRGLIEDRLCGCGRTFSECETWRPIVAVLADVDPYAMARTEEERLLTRRLPPVVARERLGRAARRPDCLAGYVAALGRLYRSIQHVTGAAVVVDSSKSPCYGYVLQQVPGIDLRVVHVVRDPRGTGYSWLRGHRRRTGDVLAAALVWNAWNLAAEGLWSGDPDRYRRLRYEEFAAAPRATVARILELAGVEGAESSFVDDRTVTLSVNHTVAGNRNRFRSGPTAIRLDDEWRKALPPVDRFLVAAATFPLLRRRGYRINGPPGVRRLATEGLESSGTRWQA